MEWIVKFMKGGHVEVKVNNFVGPCFETFKGLRHGGFLLPLIFYVVVHALAING